MTRRRGHRLTAGLGQLLLHLIARRKAVLRNGPLSPQWQPGRAGKAGPISITPLT